MNWLVFALVVLIAGVITSFSDWLFMGVIFHDKYAESPDLWRANPGGERNKIVISQLIAPLSCAAFAYLSVGTHAANFEGVIAIALLAWLAGPAIVLAQMVLWTKLHPLIGLSHALGWLARFMITGLLSAWLL